jgi:hypothetical protein
MEVNLIVISENIPEDGRNNFSRKPWCQKLATDGAGIHFLSV